MKAQWVDKQYSVSQLQLGSFCAAISWAHDGYRAEFERWRLKRSFPNAEDAKKAAEKLARQKLTEALEAL